MHPDLPHLRIFVSSPGDVQQERQQAAAVIARLAAEFAHRAVIEPIFWEHEPLRSTASFQEQIPRPAEAEIVVCILWSRIGTRLPSHITRPDGTTYASGTEFEFEDAASGFRAFGKPDLLVYRKTADPVTSLRNKQAALERFDQMEALDAFCERWFNDTREGTLVAAFYPFDDAARFEELLEVNLRKFVEMRLPPGVPAMTTVAPPPTWTAGSPFRGLQYFDAQHAAVFFGRTRAVDDVLGAVRAQIEEARAFVLVLGMSGGGKSSLLRAGVLPLLTQPGVIEGVGLWRTAVLLPSEAVGDLFDLLARKLLDAVAELGADGTTAADLARLLRSQPEGAGPLLKGGLSQAAAAVQREEKLESQPAARLVLLVDQLEELFTSARINADERKGLVAALDALARSGRVVVLATMRSDFYPRCAEIPALLALKEGRGQYDLAAPTPSEVGQLIRLPALAAGLRCEEDPASGERLDDLLRDAAIASPESLPLLEFALEELYQRRRDDGLLTHEAYRAIGGVEGAIATRAEAVFASLALGVQQSMAAVFRALVSVSAGNEDSVVRRAAPFADVARTAETRAFVDAFVAARLFVTDRLETTPIVRIVHEALLRTWPRLRTWIEEESEFLRIRVRVANQAERWEREGRRADLLLPKGKPLLEAQSLASAWQGNLDTHNIAYVESSGKRARSELRLRRAAAIGLVVLTIAAGLAARLADRSRRASAGQLAVVLANQGEQLLSSAAADKAIVYLTRALALEDSTARRFLVKQASRRSLPMKTLKGTNLEWDPEHDVISLSPSAPDDLADDEVDSGETSETATTPTPDPAGEAAVSSEDAVSSGDEPKVYSMRNGQEVDAASNYSFRPIKDDQDEDLIRNRELTASLSDSLRDYRVVAASQDQRFLLITALREAGAAEAAADGQSEAALDEDTSEPQTDEEVVEFQANREDNKSRELAVWDRKEQKKLELETLPADLLEDESFFVVSANGAFLLGRSCSMHSCYVTVLWNVATGRATALQRWSASTFFAFSPDSRLALIGGPIDSLSRITQVSLWDLETVRLVGLLDNVGSNFDFAAFDTTGGAITTVEKYGQWESVVRVWLLEDVVATRFHHVDAQEGRADGVACRPTSRTHEPPRSANGEPIATRFEVGDDSPPVVRVELVANGERVVSIAEGTEATGPALSVWGIDGRLIGRHSVDVASEGFGASPDGTSLLLGEDGAIVLWHPDTNDEAVLDGEYGQYVAFSPDGKLFAMQQCQYGPETFTPAHGIPLALHDGRSGRRLMEYPGLSPWGKWGFAGPDKLWSATEDGLVAFYDVSVDERPSALLDEIVRCHVSWEFAPGGQLKSKKLDPSACEDIAPDSAEAAPPRAGP